MTRSGETRPGEAAEPVGATGPRADATPREVAEPVEATRLDPGPIDTGWMDADTRTALTARQPLGRLGTPKDIADVTAFLLSNAGRWVSGQLLHTDGGFSA